MSEPAKSTLLLVDGLSMAFRAFFGLPVDNFATDTGQPTNAVYGFTGMLATLIKEFKPTHVVVAFDVGSHTFRTDRLPSYKAGRDETPEDFKGQVPLIREVLEALNVAAVGKDNFEADDILATYARQGSEAGMKVWVCSGDRDTFQLIDDNVTVLYPRKGVSDLVRMDDAAVVEKYGVHAKQYSDLAALVGEKSDNLPGVPSVGPKTAAKWINEFGTLEAILTGADSIGGKVGEKLREHLDAVRLNRELNALLTDLELTHTLDQLEYEGADAASIHRICDALQFGRLRDRLLALVPAGAADASATSNDAPVEVAVRVANAVEAITALQAASVYVEGTGGADADAWALGAAAEGGAYGLELASISPEEESSLAAWLADPSVEKTLHGAKDAWHQLAARGLELGGVVRDTQIEAFLVHPDQRSFDLVSICQRYLGESPAEGAAGGELDLGLDASEAASAGTRAHFVALLAGELGAMVADRGMNPVYRELEVPLVKALGDMESRGVAVDVAHLELLAGECAQRAEAAAAQAYGAIGGAEVNLASPKQLQEVLFEQLKMPKTKKIKTGYTTDAAALADLHQRNPHPFLEALLSHRDATKLGQIIETLRKSVRADGRIHTTFSQVVASTGRLSSKDPNLQNIPIRTPDGHRIREAFIVGDGYESLLTADYSQIEMRIMAHLSGDEALIEAFKAGEDLHRFVGSRVFGVPPESVSPEMRSQVKAMSYGLAYGLSAFGLSKQLGTPVGEAQRLMDDYFDRFGGVRDYLASVVEQARKVGYTETLAGRRRYFSDLTSDNRQRREMAERGALNAPIQGTAADLIKKAMLGVETRFASEGLKSRQLLQVHDELVVEVAPGERERVEAIVREEMAGAADLSVPLDVNVGVGVNWRSAGH